MHVQMNCRRIIAILCGLVGACLPGTAQSLRIGAETFTFTASADTPNTFGFTLVGIGTTDGSSIPFRFAGIQDSACFGCGDVRLPDFVVVSPSSGIAPTLVTVGLNPNVVPYLRSGTYTFSVAFAKEGESCPACAGARMILRLSAYPAPSLSAVVGAATLQPGAIAPGQIVSVFGERLATPPVSSQFDSSGLYPTTLGNSTVTFDGVPAALLYASTNQINAVVPYGIAGKTTVDVVVTHNLAKSPPLSVPVADTSPGIFTATGTGTGQGAILNNGVSLNGPNNPAPKGSVIVLFGTGAGLWSELRPNAIRYAFPDGSIFIGYNARIVPTAAVSLTIGGQPARIQYSGPAPYQSSGVIQVNAVVPDTVGSGPQQVVLTVGQNSNAQQNVTVAVQ